MIPEDADGGYCSTCWAPVLLDHDPPCEACHDVTCANCPPHECPLACPACDGAGEIFRDDPTDPPYGYTAHPCHDCNQETT